MNRKSITIEEYENIVEEYKQRKNTWALFFFKRAVESGEIEVTGV